MRRERNERRALTLPCRLLDTCRLSRRFPWLTSQLLTIWVDSRDNGPALTAASQAELKYFAEQMRRSTPSGGMILEQVRLNALRLMILCHSKLHLESSRPRLGIGCCHTSTSEPLISNQVSPPTAYFAHELYEMPSSPCMLETDFPSLVSWYAVLIQLLSAATSLSCGCCSKVSIVGTPALTTDGEGPQGNVDMLVGINLAKHLDDGVLNVVEVTFLLSLYAQAGRSWVIYVH